jgi:hypothetical protein
MRYLIVLLLLSSVCRGQKQNAEVHTKVITYRLIEMPDDGPCSVLSYVTSLDGGIVFTAESSDQKLISELLKIKKESRKWKSEYHDCGPGYGSIDETPNMFIFYGASKNDTLFTTEGHHAVIFPKKFKRYLDKDKRIEKSLTGDFAEFFRRDFREDMWFTMLGDLDSIPNNSVLFKSKNFDRRAKIEDFGTESFILEIDTVYNGNDPVMEAKKYSLDRNIYSFNYKGQLETVEVFNLTDFYIDGIKPGDHEDVLLKRYSNSTQRQFPRGTRYEEIKHNYSYTVKVENDGGRVYYHIKDKIIHSITIKSPFLKP